MRWLWLTLVTLLASAAPAADCGRFIEWTGAAVERYRASHRIHPLEGELRAFASRWTPTLWVSAASWRPVDFDAYLERARLYSVETGEVLADPPLRPRLATMTPEAQCGTYLEAPELSPADPAPVYVQAFADAGPDGSPGWLYLKYSFVFDWSGLARERSFAARIGAFLTGGDAERWHRLDVHTAAVLGFDASRTLRTLTLAQHNFRRTHLAGVDFDPDEGVHLAAARSTNELYLDTGARELQIRRAVPSALQWEHLVSADQHSWLWQRDEFVGRNAGGQRVALAPVFIDPAHPLAVFPGLLAPPRRMLGMYIGRDGPPGYDFTGTPEIPDAVTLGYWRENDTTLLELLDRHLDGFRDTNWEAIRAYLAGRLVQDLATVDD